jgi:hypothetical protein
VVVSKGFILNQHNDEGLDYEKMILFVRSDEPSYFTICKAVSHLKSQIWTIPSGF